MPAPSMFDMFSLINQGNEDIVSKMTTMINQTDKGFKKTEGQYDLNLPSDSPEARESERNAMYTEQVSAEGYNPLTDSNWSDKDQAFREQYVGELDALRDADGFDEGVLGALNYGQFGGFIDDSDYRTAILGNSAEYGDVNFVEGENIKFRQGQKSTWGDWDGKSSYVEIKNPDGSWTKYKTGDANAFQSQFGISYGELLNKAKSGEAGTLLNSMSQSVVSPTGAESYQKVQDLKQNFYNKALSTVGLESIASKMKAGSDELKAFYDAIGNTEGYSDKLKGIIGEGFSELEDLFKAGREKALKGNTFEGSTENTPSGAPAGDPEPTLVNQTLGVDDDEVLGLSLANKYRRQK